MVGWMDVKDGHFCWQTKWCQGKRAGKFPAPHHLKVFFVVDSGCLGYSCASELVRVAWRANWRVLLNSPAFIAIIIQLPEPPPEKSLERVEFSFFFVKMSPKRDDTCYFSTFSHLCYTIKSSGNLLEGDGWDM